MVQTVLSFACVGMASAWMDLTHSHVTVTLASLEQSVRSTSMNA